jgi:predicted ATPase
MLKRLYAYNYRTLVNFEWRPPQASVLVGRNGAGKSAIFEVLWLLKDVVCEGKRADEVGYHETQTAWLYKGGDQVFEVELDVEGRSFTYRVIIGLRGNEPRPVLTEHLTCDGAKLYEAIEGEVKLFGDPPTAQARATFHLDRRRSFIAALEERPDNRSIIRFRDALQAIWILKPDPRRVEGRTTTEDSFLEPDLANFSSWYRTRLQEDPDAMEALRTDLRDVIEGFDQLRYERLSAEARDLRVRFVFGATTHELPWTKLSDGQRMLIALYGVLHFGFKRARLILLDEVENYVSPEELQPWVRAVLELVHDANTQVIVISHHPESINYVATESAWRVWRDPELGSARIEQLQPDLDVGETAYELAKRGP